MSLKLHEAFIPTGTRLGNGGTNYPEKPSQVGQIGVFRSPYSHSSVLVDVAELDRYGKLRWGACAFDAPRAKTEIEKALAKESQAYRIKSLIAEWDWEVRNSQELWQSTAKAIKATLEKASDLTGLHAELSRMAEAARPMAVSVYFDRAVESVAVLLSQCNAGEAA